MSKSMKEKILGWLKKWWPVAALALTTLYVIFITLFHLIPAAATAIRTYNERKDYAECAGEVSVFGKTGRVSVLKRYGSEKIEVFYPYYKYEVDGVEYRAESEDYFRWPMESSRVVYYSPENPEKSALQRVFIRWDRLYNGGISLVLLVAFIYIWIVIYKFWKDAKPNERA